MVNVGKMARRATAPGTGECGAALLSRDRLRIGRRHSEPSRGYSLTSAFRLPCGGPYYDTSPRSTRSLICPSV
jgi:hypothetical protein